MEPKNYTSTQCAFWGVLCLILTACNSDTKHIEQSTTSESNTPSNKAIQPKVEGDFSVADSNLITAIGLPTQLCLPIVSKTANPSFTVTATKSPLFGSITPSVNTGILCLNYKPNSAFEGLDQFDCKICLTNTGFCQEKTWYVEVKKDMPKPFAPVSASPIAKPKRKKEESVYYPPSQSASSTIFDPNKKNNDGYVPKN